MKQKVFFLTLLLFAFYFISSTVVYKDTSIPIETSLYWDRNNSYDANTVLSNTFSPTKREFTCKADRGSLWVLIKFDKDASKGVPSYALDLGQCSVSKAELFIKNDDNSWRPYRITGNTQNKRKMQTSFMRDVLIINGNHLEEGDSYNLLLKIAPNYGKTSIITLHHINNYSKHVMSATIFHSTISCMCFSIAFMALIYGLLFSDVITKLISVNIFIFLVTQLQLTGMGPTYLWNTLSRSLPSNDYISYFFMRLIIANIAIILFNLPKYKTNGKCCIPYKVSFYAILSLGVLDFLINCFIPSQKVIFFSFHITVIIQDMLFLYQLILVNRRNRKELPFQTFYWAPVFALNIFKHVVDILPLISTINLILFKKDTYLLKYLSFFTFIIPVLIKTLKEIRSKFKDLRDKLEKYELKIQTDEIDNNFYVSTIHQLLDMNTMAINALHMPELKFDTYDSKEIKNLIQYNLVKAQSFLNTSLQIRTKKALYDSNIILQSFFKSCVTNIETMAKRNHIRINVRSTVGDDDFIRANPYIIQLIFASLANSVIKLTEENSILFISLNYEDNKLSYTLQNEMTPESQKALKKIITKNNSCVLSEDSIDSNTYEFEIIQRACNLYNGNLLIKPQSKDVQFTAELYIEHLKTMGHTDAIYADSFYKPELNKDKTPIPIRLPFSYLKNEPLSIFIAEDNAVNISYFQSILQEYGVVKTASTGLEAWNILNETHLQPDIIISEYNLPMISGMEFFTKCKSSFNLQNIPFIMLLQSSESAKMQELYSEGVSSCLIKPFTTIDFFNQISSVLTTSYKAKNAVLKQIDKVVISSKNNKDEETTNLFEKTNLSAREKQIAILISVGKSDKEIAEELNISPATVATHNKNIFKKLSVHSRIELIKKVQ